MTLGTLLGFLVGRREAIFTVASSRLALPVSFLLVLSAALAREYDGEALVANPRILLLSPAASLVVSFLLFAVLLAVTARRDLSGFGRGYLSFLGVFWMTAPLAWIYAIPFERFLDATGATRANLAALALVAAWRVALMTRAVSVLSGARLVVAFFPVALAADLVLLPALGFAPLPVIPMMGGIREGPEKVLLDASNGARALGLLTLPLWLAGSVVVASRRAIPALSAAPRGPHRASRGLWMAAIASVLVWAGVLPFTQREQALRLRVERTFARGEVKEALVEASAHPPTDFPPHWLPPPRIGYGDDRTEIESLCTALEAASSLPAAPWLLEAYRWRIEELLERYLEAFLTDEDRARLRELVARVPVWRDLPERYPFLREERRGLREERRGTPAAPAAAISPDAPASAGTR